MTQCRPAHGPESAGSSPAPATNPGLLVRGSADQGSLPHVCCPGVELQAPATWWTPRWRTLAAGLADTGGAPGVGVASALGQGRVSGRCDCRTAGDRADLAWRGMGSVGGRRGACGGRFRSRHPGRGAKVRSAMATWATTTCIDDQIGSGYTFVQVEGYVYRRSGRPRLRCDCSGAARAATTCCAARRPDQHGRLPVRPGRGWGSALM